MELNYEYKIPIQTRPLYKRIILLPRYWVKYWKLLKDVSLKDKLTIIVAGTKLIIGK